MTYFEINDKLTIACEYYETSRSWGHRAEILLDGELVDKKKIVYYNRTWEAHQFDSLLSKCSDSKELTKQDKADIMVFIKNRKGSF